MVSSTVGSSGTKLLLGNRLWPLPSKKDRNRSRMSAPDCIKAAAAAQVNAAQYQQKTQQQQQQQQHACWCSSQRVQWLLSCI
jgi:hypothetical protein